MTRRRVLGAAATGAAVAVAAPVLGAFPASAATTSYLDADPLLHLLRRATYGTTPALITEARTLGATAWLNQQLAPSLIDDSACDALVARFPNLAHSIGQVRADLGVPGLHPCAARDRAAEALSAPALPGRRRNNSRRASQ